MQIKSNFFDKNIIAIINSDGEIIGIEKKDGEFNHEEVFKRAENQIPNLLNGFLKKLSTSSGFEIASFVAAKGNIVFWPSSIINPDDMLISLPQKATTPQIQKAYQLLDLVKDLEIYAAISYFNDEKSDITTKTLSISDDSNERYQNLLNYLNKILEINKIEDDLLSEIDKVAKVDVDVRTFKKR